MPIQLQFCYVFPAILAASRYATKAIAVRTQLRNAQPKHKFKAQRSATHANNQIQNAIQNAISERMETILN